MLSTQNYQKYIMHKIQQVENNFWISGLALVKFDFDEGQIVEQIYPQNFTKKQQKSIAMLSFPDSNSFDTNEGMLKYIFKVKRNNGKILYAFVCFKQRKDPNIFRGYFQKSLVILSELPLISFFSTLAEFLVFKLFAQQSQKLPLQTIYKQMLDWPQPQPLTCLTLTILNYTFNINIPTFKKQHCSEQYKTKNVLKIQNFHQVGYFQQTKLLQSFNNLIPSLWSLWELVLLNKPLMIVADSPHIVSNAILSAVSLISPLEAISDYKPYMTVYDDDYHQIQKMVDKWPERMNTMIGVTNPLFLKSLRKYPNILSLTNPSDNRGMQTRIKKDQTFCQLVLDMQKSKQTGEMIEGLLRRHFRKLTQMFMQQFQLYFLQQKNDLKRFKKDDFLRFLKNQKIEFGECFQSKRSLIKLYTEFVDSLNFHRFILSRNVIKAF